APPRENFLFLDGIKFPDCGGDGGLDWGDPGLLIDVPVFINEPILERRDDDPF
ncbi:unnamed protein product, partial [Allacma fusca]